MTWVSGLAIVGYALALFFLLHRAFSYRIMHHVWGWAGWLLHAQYLHQMIDTPAGQVLGDARMASFVIWLTWALAHIGVWWRPWVFPRILLSAAALSSILLLWYAPGHVAVIQDINHPTELFHVFSCFLGMALLLLSSLQAFSLLLQDRQIKTGGALWFPELTPLELQEKWLFQSLISAFFIISLGLLAGFWYNPHLHQNGMWWALGAWAGCGALVYGRHRFGWRSRVTGPVAAACTVLLILAYWGHL